MTALHRGIAYLFGAERAFLVTVNMIAVSQLLSPTF